MKIDVQRRLSALAAEHGVVGASLAVRFGGETTTAVTGVLRQDTQQPVTPESVFQMGSITKVWTATLVMQLVDDGLLDLDAPVVSYLPDFRVADDAVTKALTARHLLCHSSGIDGDVFLDTGRGDDALARYVAAMSVLEQNHPLGAIMSYTNSGYALLGHLVAVLRGGSWEEVLRERLLHPLNLTRTGVFPEEALLHPVAVGHLWDPSSDTIALTPQWGPWRSMGPTGGMTSTPLELLELVAGTHLLSASSLSAMRTAQIPIKDPAQGTHWGLGWVIDDWEGHVVLRHDGTTTGQLSYVDVLPSDGLSIALMTNGGRSPAELHDALVAEIATSLVGVRRHEPLRPPAVPVSLDASRYVGTYTRVGFHARVDEVAAGALRLTVIIGGALVGLVPDQVFELVGYDGDEILLGRAEGTSSWVPVVFFEVDGVRYFTAAGLAFRRQ